MWPLTLLDIYLVLPGSWCTAPVLLSVGLKLHSASQWSCLYEISDMPIHRIESLSVRELLTSGSSTLHSPDRNYCTTHTQEKGGGRVYHEVSEVKSSDNRVEPYTISQKFLTPSPSVFFFFILTIFNIAL